jgi:predicted metal-dependent TIM-barrel fold hydrolase
MNSACDWGVSVPLAVPRTAIEMKRRKWDADRVDTVVFGNPLRFMSQNPRFHL